MELVDKVKYLSDKKVIRTWVLWADNDKGFDYRLIPYLSHIEFHKVCHLGRHWEGVTDFETQKKMVNMAYTRAKLMEANI
jgi:hypothetical protein